MQAFSRPFTARQIEARGRARSLGVRVEVVDPGPTTCHAASPTPAPFTCSPAPDRLGLHLSRLHLHRRLQAPRAVERRSEREGWAFGRVAPRPLFAA